MSCLATGTISPVLCKGDKDDLQFSANLLHSPHKHIAPVPRAAIEKGSIAANGRTYNCHMRQDP